MSENNENDESDTKKKKKIENKKNDSEFSEVPESVTFIEDLKQKWGNKDESPTIPSVDELLKKLKRKNFSFLTDDKTDSQPTESSKIKEMESEKHEVITKTDNFEPNDQEQNENNEKNEKNENNTNDKNTSLDENVDDTSLFHRQLYHKKKMLHLSFKAKRLK